ncbi:hypothetical protein [Roseobacter sp. CCS2]|uniref:hypothetical protein n=1 Tax=Roseobacter sp. CCS2 TaxID=391593 RepID=UPI0000F3E444|nr:hypothetical protein [Roseobacter sp. CCS2]EBA12033.1 hypothetical protein RCCS2_12089 [Roseobacter sp. CCS2]
MKKYLLASALVTLSACGLGNKICEFTFDNNIQGMKNDISFAENNLERGYARGIEVESMRSLNLSEVNTDPEFRTARCIAPDLDGNDRRYLCYYQLVSQGGERIRIDPDFERQVIADTTRELAEKRANRAQEIQTCMGN